MIPSAEDRKNTAPTTVARLPCMIDPHRLPVLVMRFPPTSCSERTREHRTPLRNRSVRTFLRCLPHAIVNHGMCDGHLIIKDYCKCRAIDILKPSDARHTRSDKHDAGVTSRVAWWE